MNIYCAADLERFEIAVMNHDKRHDEHELVCFKTGDVDVLSSYWYE